MWAFGSSSAVGSSRWKTSTRLGVDRRRVDRRVDVTVGVVGDDPRRGQRRRSTRRRTRARGGSSSCPWRARSRSSRRAGLPSARRTTTSSFRSLAAVYEPPHAYPIQTLPFATSLSKSVWDDHMFRTSFFFSIRNFLASSSCVSVQLSQSYGSNAVRVPVDQEVLDRAVPPRDLSLVAVVVEQVPRLLAVRLDLVRAVQHRREAPVGGDEVLLAVDLAALDERRVEIVEVRQQRRVPRLDGVEVDPVLNVATRTGG